MSKKYYWLKLQRNFFKRHDIRIIENMPNGKDYILFYLKLLCESIDHDGTLRFSDEIPYNEDMLSTITNTNVDIVRSAIKIFTQLQMMEIMDDGTYYMNEVYKMIGSSSQDEHTKESTRLRVQAFRERQKQNQIEQKRYSNVTCNGEKEIEIEKDIEIDIDKRKSKKKSEPKIDFEKMVDEKLFPEAISEKVKEWLKYKTEIKKPYNTETGFNTFLKKVRTNLIRYGENAVIEVIDDSMSNGYQGVIWDRLEKTKAYHKQTKADELNDFYAMAADWAAKEE